ncbi:MAG TPA: hypothetical protein VHG90_03795 [Acidimicrobiales bacterium]|nr:hypothetical protein [Acidimicrobiales bacterium]
MATGNDHFNRVAEEALAKGESIGPFEHHRRPLVRAGRAAIFRIPPSSESSFGP